MPSILLDKVVVTMIQWSHNMKGPTCGTTYLGDPGLELVWLLAIRLNYLGAGTEHGLCL